jgi:hypothetical protein
VSSVRETVAGRCTPPPERRARESWRLGAWGIGEPSRAFWRRSGIWILQCQNCPRIPLRARGNPVSPFGRDCPHRASAASTRANRVFQRLRKFAQNNAGGYSAS